MKNPVKYLLSQGFDKVIFEQDPGPANHYVTVKNEGQEIAFARDSSYHKAAQKVVDKLKASQERPNDR